MDSPDGDLSDVHAIGHKSKLLLIIYMVTTHLETWKSQGIPKWSGKSQGKWKKSGEVKSGVFFQALNTPKLVFRPGLCPGDPAGGAYDAPQTPSRLGRGHLIPFPQLLQPQLLNN